ncbi:MAG: 16S rRNA (uracil(1498)-N(3))-methyltransferase [Clostridiales bacterium]|nr:16S rRNA (uracil(1498)-N(3))-methyltransferase [Clostridiales bacterium]
MTRLFIDNRIDETENTYEITGDEARYLTDVLRMRPGEELILCDPDRVDYVCEILSASKGLVAVSIRDRHPNRNEPKFTATVYQGLAKGERMDISIQKSVELGVSRYVPTACSRSIVKIKEEKNRRPEKAERGGESGSGKGEKKSAGKTGRWQAIALEAARQCGRGIVPVVDTPMNLEEALKEASGTCDLVLFPWEEEKEGKLGEILGTLDFKSNPKIGIFIGPEGGFSEEEAALAQKYGAKLVTLGRRILRTETAAPAVLAMLVYASELV